MCQRVRLLLGATGTSLNGMVSICLVSTRYGSQRGMGGFDTRSSSCIISNRQVCLKNHLVKKVLLILSLHMVIHSDHLPGFASTGKPWEVVTVKLSPNHLQSCDPIKASDCHKQPPQLLYLVEIYPIHLQHLCRLHKQYV